MRVYMAGPYSGTNVIEILTNMRDGMNMATRMFEAGFNVFCPWHDYHYALCSQSGLEPDVKRYHENSMAWLEVSDMVVWVGLHSEGEIMARGGGCYQEYLKAQELGIPQYFGMGRLIQERPELF
jgi:hypothetical protein